MSKTRYYETTLTRDEFSRICKLAMFQAMTPATFSLPDDYEKFTAVIRDMAEDDVLNVLNVVKHFISVSKLNGVRFHAHNIVQVASLKRFEAWILNYLKREG